MFDDLKQGSTPDPKNTPQKDSNQATSKESVGEMAMEENAELPKKPVDDMFGDIDPVADKGSALQSGKIRAVSQTGDPANTGIPQDLQIDQIAVEKDDNSKIKKMAAMAISILLLAAIATFIYAYFFSGTGDPDTPDQVENEEVVPEEEVIPEEEEVVPEEEVAVEEEEEIDESKLDYDGDSLTNSEEDALGTDPFEPDTDNDRVFDWDEVTLYKSDPLEPDSDGDGLDDYDEIYIWGTDPNQVDTDNDGYGDGVEVANDYNPFGDGDIEDFVPPGQRGLE